VIVNKTYLVTRNARDKVQVVITELEQLGNDFVIRRTTGQYQGVLTSQPELKISVGKAKRSVLQQAELEYNSILNKYQDKGYKKLDSLTNKKFDELTPSEIDALVPTLKMDANGNLKPMLAKSSTQCQNSVLDKVMYCSKKLNGVRCMMKWSPELNKVITISRGGKDYNASTTHLTAEVSDFLKKNPTYILDGELYHFGHYLQELSGIARLDHWEDRCNILQYWIYDIADGEKIFKNESKKKIEDRLTILEEMQVLFANNPKIHILEHIRTESWDAIQKLHDRWVKEGFEGLVARKPDKVYEFGKRSSTMIKVKQYQEEEFEIIDYSEKLREEDFCFIMQTKDGKVFEAKPIGDRQIKADYINNIDNIIGRMGTVKFFELSKDGIPQQPIFQAVRMPEDM
jgi:ATP-dependent DNA ligase